MARWECIVCGLIYDEKEGWPDDGIPAGTKWSDVPDDWLCPDCGVGKDDFELIPGSEGEAVDAAASESEEAEHDSDQQHAPHCHRWQWSRRLWSSQWPAKAGC